MVWVLTGQVESKETGECNLPNLTINYHTLADDLLAVRADEEHALPTETSHYLRPCRSYRLGRMAYTTTATQQKKGLPIKPRLLDFRLKTTQISKEGAWELRCDGDDWDEVSAAELAILHLPLQ